MCGEHGGARGWRVEGVDGLVAARSAPWPGRVCRFAEDYSIIIGPAQVLPATLVAGCLRVVFELPRDAVAFTRILEF